MSLTESRVQQGIADNGMWQDQEPASRGGKKRWTLGKTSKSRMQSFGRSMDTLRRLADVMLMGLCPSLPMN
jgi:hypothetical protein